MKKTVIINFLVFLAITLFGQEKTFIREYTYKASDLDSKISCRAITINQLRLMLLNEVGVYVESEQLLKTTDVSGKFSQNFVENIAALSAGITKLEILDEKWNGETFWMKASITIDKKNLEESLKQLVADRQKTKELEEINRKLNEATQEIEKLKTSARNTNNQSQSDNYNSEIKKLSESNSVLASTEYGKHSLTKFNEQGYLAIRDSSSLKLMDQKTQALYSEHIDYYNRAWNDYNNQNFANAWFYFKKSFSLPFYKKYQIKIDEEILERRTFYAFMAILKDSNSSREDRGDLWELVNAKCNPEQKRLAKEAYSEWKKKKH